MAGRQQRERCSSKKRKIADPEVRTRFPKERLSEGPPVPPPHKTCSGEAPQAPAAAQPAAGAKIFGVKPAAGAAPEGFWSSRRAAGALPDRFLEGCHDAGPIRIVFGSAAATSFARCCTLPAQRSFNGAACEPGWRINCRARAGSRRQRCGRCPPADAQEFACLPAQPACTLPARRRGVCLPACAACVRGLGWLQPPTCLPRDRPRQLLATRCLAARKLCTPAPVAAVTCRRRTRHTCAATLPKRPVHEKTTTHISTFCYWCPRRPRVRAARCGCGWGD